MDWIDAVWDLVASSTIPAVASTAYWLTELIKWLTGGRLGKEYPPIIATVIGVAVAALVYALEPAMLPVSSWASALTIGACSGLTASGIHQMLTRGGD